MYLDQAQGEWGGKMTDEPLGESVPVITMNELVESHLTHETIDLLKCDIEGAEKELFQNCADWIWRVRNIVIELHFGYSCKDFYRDLERAGWAFKEISCEDKEYYSMYVVFLQRVD